MTNAVKTPINIVWLKRDLRLHDHAPLTVSCAERATLVVFCWDPEFWLGGDHARQHAAFVQECLAEMRKELRVLGLELLEWPGSMTEALSAIAARYHVCGLFSHEETGNLASFKIDRAVADWCRHHRVTWIEYPQNGVVRRLKSRDQWTTLWEQRMRSPLAPALRPMAPSPAMIAPDLMPSLPAGNDKPRRQRGGRAQAESLLDSFLSGRAQRYRGGISSPLRAVSACSRLSPYLAWGVFGMRETVQATRRAMQVAQAQPHDFGPAMLSGLRAFEQRLHWHCHFMQKLESQPELEIHNLHSAFDGIRDEALSTIESHRRLDAWCAGETGWPLVDACMAMLRETGWINFRMRAMLMSNASYLLWLHWRHSGLHLAREFLDYEAGIHWPQSQMQSGTTGINTLRMYNPVKQAMDQDPDGTFVRRWLPSLRRVPDSWLFEPWRMPASLQQRSGCVIERDYPAPCVDIGLAMREARAMMSKAIRSGHHAVETADIVRRHASRKSAYTRRDKVAVKSEQSDHRQQTLF